MGIIILGALALIVILAGLRLFSEADPKLLSKLTRYAGAGILAALALGAVVFDRIGLATLLAGFAWTVYTGGRLWPPGGPQGQTNGPPRNGTAMSRSEALEVLGLQEGASEEDIRAAHRKLISQIHPDKGGTDYLAAKINEAKDVLLGK